MTYQSVVDVVRANPNKSNKEIELLLKKLKISHSKSAVSVARHYVKNHPDTGSRAAKPAAEPAKRKYKRHKRAAKAAGAAAAIPGKNVEVDLPSDAAAVPANPYDAAIAERRAQVAKMQQQISTIEGEISALELVRKLLKH